jgi:histidinol phosphatase-like enzyme
MRIVIDLDGVICAIKGQNESYADVAPVPGAAERLRELRGNGHHEIYFGKPNGHVYIDDRAVRFQCWSDITEQMLERQSGKR